MSIRCIGILCILVFCMVMAGCVPHTTVKAAARPPVLCRVGTKLPWDKSTAPRRMLWRIH